MALKVELNKIWKRYEYLKHVHACVVKFNGSQYGKFNSIKSYRCLKFWAIKGLNRSFVCVFDQKPVYSKNSFMKICRHVKCFLWVAENCSDEYFWNYLCAILEITHFIEIGILVIIMKKFIRYNRPQMHILTLFNNVNIHAWFVTWKILVWI